MPELNPEELLRLLSAIAGGGEMAAVRPATGLGGGAPLGGALGGMAPGGFAGSVIGPGVVPGAAPAVGIPGGPYRGPAPGPRPGRFRGLKAAAKWGKRAKAQTILKALEEKAQLGLGRGRKVPSKLWEFAKKHKGIIGGMVALYVLSDLLGYQRQLQQVGLQERAGRAQMQAQMAAQPNVEDQLSQMMLQKEMGRTNVAFQQAMQATAAAPPEAPAMPMAGAGQISFRTPI